MKAYVRRTIAASIIAAVAAALVALTVAGAGAAAKSGRREAQSTSGLTATQLQTLALNAAKGDGDASPTNMEAVQTTHGEAMGLMYPGSPPHAFNGGVPDDTPVYVIAMTGQFTAYGALVPQGVSIPTGTEESLVFDMQGTLLDYSLNDNPEPGLAQAGSVMQLDP